MIYICKLHLKKHFPFNDKKSVKVIFLIAVFSLLLINCSQPNENRITIKGSDTMVMLVQLWTEFYPNKSAVQFQVTGGGSGVGIAALLNATTDVCSASRPIKKKEIAKLNELYNTSGYEVRVATDGIAVYVHKDNPITKLTIDQVQKIFIGEISNWKQLGGNDEQIILYSRENSSGTYEFFKDRVLKKKDFAANAQNLVGSSALISAVSKDPYGIGFSSAAFSSGISVVALAENDTSEYYLPTEETIANATYPVSRFLYFYLREKPSGETKKFIDWILTPEGQSVVHKAGYFPVKLRKDE